MLTLHRLGTLECIGDIEMWNKVIQSPDPRDRDSRLSSNAFSMVIAGTIRQAALQRDWARVTIRAATSRSLVGLLSPGLSCGTDFLQEQTERRSRRRIASSKSQNKRPFHPLPVAASRLVAFRKPLPVLSGNTSMMRRAYMRPDAPMTRLAVRCRHGYDPPQPEIGRSLSFGRHWSPRFRRVHS